VIKSAGRPRTTVRISAEYTNEQKHLGSSIDDFLKDEGIFDEAQAQAIKEVIAGQLADAMKKKKISKSRLATLLKTSRSQVDRLLDLRTTSPSQACSVLRLSLAAGLRSNSFETVLFRLIHHPQRSSRVPVCADG